MFLYHLFFLQVGFYFQLCLYFCCIFWDFLLALHIIKKKKKNNPHTKLLFSLAHTVFPLGSKDVDLWPEGILVWLVTQAFFKSIRRIYSLSSSEGWPALVLMRFIIPVPVGFCGFDLQNYLNKPVSESKTVDRKLTLLNLPCVKIIDFLN